VSDQRLYEKVMDELSQHGPNAGLWAKAFAESNGVESKAKALYLRYRVRQLDEIEREKMRAEKARVRQVSEIERQKKLEKKVADAEREHNDFLREEEERKKRARDEGITPMHIVLISLFVFILVAVTVKGLRVYHML